jgi:hypothetical protein
LPPRHKHPPQPYHPRSFRLLTLHFQSNLHHEDAFLNLEHPKVGHQKKRQEWKCEAAEVTWQFGDESFSHGNYSRFVRAKGFKARFTPWVVLLVGVSVSF